MEKKLSYEVNLLMFLFHSAFQKVIIAGMGQSTLVLVLKDT